jgi:hypothetical protein
MPRTFVAPNGVMFHLPAMGSASFVPSAPTHTPTPLLSNNVIAKSPSNNYQPVTSGAAAPIAQNNPASLVAQPSAPAPTAHAANMYVTLSKQAAQNNPAGF